MIMVAGIYSGYVVVLAWISNTMPRPPAKRAVALAWINAVSNSSTIYASYLYPDSDAPRYIVAMSIDCVTAFVAILAATLLRFILVRLNKKLDRGEYVKGAINDKDLQGNGYVVSHKQDPLPNSVDFEFSDWAMGRYECLLRFSKLISFEDIV